MSPRLIKSGICRRLFIKWKITFLLTLTRKSSPIIQSSMASSIVRVRCHDILVLQQISLFLGSDSLVKRFILFGIAATRLRSNSVTFCFSSIAYLPWIFVCNKSRRSIKGYIFGYFCIRWAIIWESSWPFTRFKASLPHFWRVARIVFGSRYFILHSFGGICLYWQSKLSITWQIWLLLWRADTWTSSAERFTCRLDTCGGCCPDHVVIRWHLSGHVSSWHHWTFRSRITHLSCMLAHTFSRIRLPTQSLLHFGHLIGTFKSVNGFLWTIMIFSGGILSSRRQFS